MSKTTVRFEQPIACCLACLLMVPLMGAATTPLPAAPQPQFVANLTQGRPGAGGAGATQDLPQDQQQPAQTAPPTQQSPSTQPVGTAAAPVVKAEGVPGSRPAGAAIAPAKQRRIRSFAIRVGLLVGAGIAIGTVAAASLGSPSHPH